VCRCYSPSISGWCATQTQPVRRSSNVEAAQYRRLGGHVCGSAPLPACANRDQPRCGVCSPSTLPYAYSCWPAGLLGLGLRESIRKWGRDLQQALTALAYRLCGRRSIRLVDVVIGTGLSFLGQGLEAWVAGGDGGKGGLIVQHWRSRVLFKLAFTLPFSICSAIASTIFGKGALALMDQALYQS